MPSHHPRSAAAIAAAVIALALAGCGRGPTQGELGKALFSYDEGIFMCIVGCPPATEPMAARSRVTIYVTNADDLATFTMASTDASVATFEPGGTTTVNGKNWTGVWAHSMAAGDVKLELADAQGGGVIDRLPLHVRDVKKVEIHDRDREFHDQLTIMEGGSTNLQLILRDGSGQELRGHGGLDYVYQGAASQPAFLELLFGELLITLFTGTSREHVEISAGAAGFGTLSATSPGGASLEVPIHVIDASGVTSVTVEGDDPSGTAGEPFFVNAQAMAGAEPVHSPECTWSLSDVVGPVVLSQGSRTQAEIESPAAGSATVTCTIGAASSSVNVVFK